MKDALTLLRSLRQTLSQFRFHYANEAELQRGIEQVLYDKQFEFYREYLLTPESRPDFYLTSGLVIEVKIASSTAEVMRQVARYASHEKVSGILLVTSRQHRLPESFSGKPLLIHRLTESAF